ncbi:hypothetical protein N7495_008500 [Penicillium taxi]|uniref:uncharacterized protein n=1 Tax=Penicillium taxi TaxID=168475 RepID=UPI00254509AD|nr:uncharacterized protein N7495_008500 [Penicillium taxi]KAJ5888459.1 hypothetical protein N7495_008500 [Penicillium taxi]
MVAGVVSDRNTSASGESFNSGDFLFRSFISAELTPPSTASFQPQTLPHPHLARMVQLVTTDRILTAYTAVSELSREKLDLPPSLKLQDPITHKQLLSLAKHLQPGGKINAAIELNYAPKPTILSFLLHGTTVYVPPPPKKPEPSPEYLASKARLQAKAEQAEYQRLMNPTYTEAPDYADPYAEAALFTEDTLTPSLVLNIFLSVIITGLSVYWALTKFTLPSMLATIFTSWTGPRVEDPFEFQPAEGASDAVRVLIAFFAALSVAVAESFLYAAYLGKTVRAKVKERKLKERKELIGTVGDDDDSVDAVNTSNKEEIWGKGANGGARRRVKKKWEKQKDLKDI